MVAEMSGPSASYLDLQERERGQAGKTYAPVEG